MSRNIFAPVTSSNRDKDGWQLMRGLFVGIVYVEMVTGRQLLPMDTGCTKEKLVEDA